MVSDRPIRHRSPFRFAVILPVVLLILVGFGFGEEYLRNKEIEAQIAEMQQENAKLDADRLASLQLIDTLSSSYYVEGEARKNGMGKEGEQLIIVEGQSAANSEPQTAASTDDIPNPLRWYDYFFDHEAFAQLGGL